MKLRTRRLDTDVIAIRKQEDGFVAEGPGYFIWDEDPREVLNAARELSKGNYKLNRSTRFLVLRENSEPLY